MNDHIPKINEINSSLDNNQFKLTNPKKEKGGKPKGNYENLRPGKDGQPIIRQNESADLLAKEGYDIEMLPEVKGGNGYGKKTTSNPDVEEKTNRQAERIILNLDDFKGSVSELHDQFRLWDITDLKELFIIKDGTIERWIP